MVILNILLWIAVWLQLLAASAFSMAFAGTDSFDFSLMNYLPLILLITAGMTSLIARNLSRVET